MIFLDSRYANATIFKAWDARKSQYNLTAFRTWPSYKKEFFWYEWVDSDRLDIIANRFLNNSNFWYKIMDINPEIIDPTVIAPGTLLRIPHA